MDRLQELLLVLSRLASTAQHRPLDRFARALGPEGNDDTETASIDGVAVGSEEQVVAMG
jgi:hypothetical protein